MRTGVLAAQIISPFFRRFFLIGVYTAIIHNINMSVKRSVRPGAAGADRGEAGLPDRVTGNIGKPARNVYYRAWQNGMNENMNALLRKT